MCILCAYQSNENFYIGWYSKIKHISCRFLESVWGLNFEELYLTHCEKLRKIVSIPEVEVLWVSDCPELTEINGVENSTVRCHNCRKLTFIFPKQKEINCTKCPWIKYDITYKENIRKLLMIQRFWRKRRKYRRFVSWINSSSFLEWIYQPGNMGYKYARKNYNSQKNNVIYRSSQPCEKQK